MSDLKIKIDQPSYEERLQGYMAIQTITSYTARTGGVLGSRV